MAGVLNERTFEYILYIIAVIYIYIIEKIIIAMQYMGGRWRTAWWAPLR